MPASLPPRRRAAALFAIACVASAALTLWAARGATFYADEWRYLVQSVGGGHDAVLEPALGHFIPLLTLTYRGLFHTVGLGVYWPYSVLSTALHLGLCVLLFVYARRRVGDWPALLAALPILFLGTGADTFLTLHQAAPVGSLVAGLGALLALDRRDRRGEVAACVLLAVSIGWDTQGVLLAGGVVLELLLTRGRRFAAWVPLAPLALYGVWAVAYGLGDSARTAGVSSVGDVVDVVLYVLDAAAGALAGLFGIQLSSATLQAHLPWLSTAGRVLVAVLVLLLGWVAVRRRRLLPPRAVMLAATTFAFWVVLALARSGEHGGYNNRYVFIGAVLLVLLVVELARGVAVPRRRGRVLAAVVLGATALNVVWLVVDGNFRRHESAIARAELTAVEIARGVELAGFRPETSIRMRDVTAGSWFAATRAYGSSAAYSPGALWRAPVYARAAADAVLVRALGVDLVPAATATTAARASAPSVEGVAGGQVRIGSGCVHLRLLPGRPYGALDIRAESRALRVRGAPAALLARRFAPGFTRVPLPPDSAAESRLDVPLGRSAVPWHVRFVTRGRLDVCGA